MGLIKRSSEYAYSEGAKGLHAAETSNIHASTSGIGKGIKRKIVVQNTCLDIAMGPALGMGPDSPKRRTLTPILGDAISNEKFLEFCNI